MAKYIKITPEVLEMLRNEFAKELATAKMANGEFRFTRAIKPIDRTATLHISEVAWAKMRMLVMECNKEVGWHGVAYRGDDESADEYYITDILLYPQEVTGATVNTDQEVYQDWLYDQPDEVFDNLRMQGHSHVNMSVTPSVTDEKLYESLLGQLDDSAFYIFMILNKRDDMTVLIYDMAKNVLFETNDVDVEIDDGGLGMKELFDSMDELVKEAKPAPVKYTSVINAGKTTAAKAKPKVSQKSSSLAHYRGSYYDYYDDDEGYPDDKYGYDDIEDDDDETMEWYRERCGNSVYDPYYGFSK